MDVHTTIYSLLHTSGGVSVWDKEKLTQLKSQQQGQKFTHMSNIIDQLGVLSAKAQALPKPITSSSKLLYSDSRLFLFSEGGKTIGMLKTGPKKLFYRNECGAFKEIEPICVLDFYVHEEMQRKGVGSILFEYMLQYENTNAAKLGYDRPSSKLIGFLKTRYGLSEYIPQSNNFVVFRRYFSSNNGYVETNKAKKILSPPQVHSKDKVKELPKFDDTLENLLKSREELEPLDNSEEDAQMKRDDMEPCSKQTMTSAPVLSSIQPEPLSMTLQQQQKREEHTPASSRKYVQYNPISHHYQELEVVDSKWKSGRKLNWDFSPVNQRITEQQPTHSLRSRVLFSPNCSSASNGSISSLTDSMRALSFDTPQKNNIKTIGPTALYSTNSTDSL